MAWSRPAYVIAIARQGDGWRLGAVEFVDPRQHGFPPPKLPPIARQTERMLTRNEVDTLRPALAEAGIWSIPRFFDSGADDGWALLIEARVGSGYRTVMRVNVNDDRILGLFHAAIGLTPFTMPVQVARGASGYGTSRVDPWATLQHKTAWIHLGLRDRRTRKWMTTMDFMTLGNQDLREPPIPEPGQPIKLTRLMPLTLLGHGNTGETRRLESPADKQLSDADEIEAALAPGDEVLIEEISLDKKGDLQSVWARVSPRL